MDCQKNGNLILVAISTVKIFGHNQSTSQSQSNDLNLVPLRAEKNKNQIWTIKNWGFNFDCCFNGKVFFVEIGPHPNSCPTT